MKKKTLKFLTIIVCLSIIGYFFATLSVGAELFDENNEITERFNPETHYDAMVAPIDPNIAVSGTILWTDANNTTHPARNLTVEVYDSGNLVISTTTNTSGYYSATVYSPFGGSDIYIIVKAQGLNISVRNTSSVICTYTSQTYYDVSAGASVPISLTFDLTTDMGKAISVHQALEMANRFMYDLEGGYISNINAVLSSYSTHYDYSDSYIYIKYADVSNWDLIQHEFGHYIADIFYICNYYSEASNCQYNLSDIYQDKDTGKCLAWDEGFATYFAIIAQIETQASSLNIPGVGDEIYNNGNQTVNIETAYYSQGNTYIRLGESNEIAVAGILYDLSDYANETDIDNVSGSVEEIWEYIKENECKTLSSFIDCINNYNSIEFILDLGATLSYYNVSAHLQTPTNISSNTPTFSWINQGGSALYPNDTFDLVFYDSSYNFILGIYSIYASNNSTTTSVTLTKEQWNTIKSYATNGNNIYCSIKTKQLDSPTSGPYYSNAITITLS